MHITLYSKHNTLFMQSNILNYHLKKIYKTIKKLKRKKRKKEKEKERENAFIIYLEEKKYTLSFFFFCFFFQLLQGPCPC
jgi:phosphoenolpyruvate carboxylase